VGVWGANVASTSNDELLTQKLSFTVSPKAFVRSGNFSSGTRSRVSTIEPARECPHIE
jgi:hypothetical protein